MRSIPSILGQITFRLRTPLGEAAATLPMSGRHNLMNALAAAAVATCFEIDAGADCRGIEHAQAAEDAWRSLRLRGRIHGC